MEDSNLSYLKDWVELNLIAILLGIFGAMSAILFAKIINYNGYIFEKFSCRDFKILVLIFIPQQEGLL